MIEDHFIYQMKAKNFLKGDRSGITVGVLLMFTFIRLFVSYVCQADFFWQV